MKKFENFIKESREDVVIDIYLQLMRIIGIHEKYYHKSHSNDGTKIVTDPEFKKELSNWLNRVMKTEKDNLTDELISDILPKYAKKHYPYDPMSFEEFWGGTSLAGVIGFIVDEKEKAFDQHDFIERFSEDDIYDDEGDEEIKQEDLDKINVLEEPEPILCVKDTIDGKKQNITKDEIYELSVIYDRDGVKYYELIDDSGEIGEYPAELFLSYKDASTQDGDWED